MDLLGLLGGDGEVTAKVAIAAVVLDDPKRRGVTSTATLDQLVLHLLAPRALLDLFIHHDMGGVDCWLINHAVSLHHHQIVVSVRYFFGSPMKF
ncbi:hypothetical protein D3C85_1704930 [compost metagenome]